MFSDDVKQALRQYFSHPVYYPSNYFLKLQDAREGINTVGLWRRDGVFKRALTEDSCYRAMTTRLDYFNDMKST